MESGAAKLMSAVIGLGLTLAATGQLPGALRWLMRQMPDGPPQTISLVKLNRALWGNAKTHPGTR